MNDLVRLHLLLAKETLIHYKSSHSRVFLTKTTFVATRKIVKRSLLSQSFKLILGTRKVFQYLTGTPL
uniref:AlNc14C19G1944 protein n=1 Tax=Albugo laibachii Nc14 TaxID=890382 RepID=F0W4X3_9STRA|nr:AlNc14C19G1944 [Albugo laibachii Nc14]|eukprot:CCA16163.1 AlNc14C19G1944 [Albugo laibachii Nc14]